MTDRLITGSKSLVSPFNAIAVRASAGSAALRAAGCVLGCCCLIALAAHVRIPLPGTDVPMTLQLLAVLLTGFALSPGKAVAATVLYLALGVAGLPVFAPGSAGLFGPTGGYIAGFVVAGWLIARLRGDVGAGFYRLLIAGLTGTASVFVVGVAWRVLWFGGDVQLAAATGLVPFIPKAVVELFLALAVVTALRHRRRNFAARTAL